jgi:predicted ribosome quality control (RQC) complex YloA/Tae2 family protein
MTVRRVLTRLLRLRELEEEQSRLGLEATVGVRNRVQQDMDKATDWQEQGRRSFAAGIAGRDSISRTGAVLEVEQARQRRLRIYPRLQAADSEVARQREEFLLRRTGRRQVETLVENEKGIAEIEAGRRAQQMLDDWYGRRGQKKGAGPRFVSSPVLPVDNRTESKDTESAGTSVP